MHVPLVTIICPVYKVEQYLHTCINSVLSQSFENWELIIIDDGSPDKSGAICDEYAHCDNRIKVLHTANGGPSCARNRGLDYPPAGLFVTFLDSDDFWHPDYLQIMIALQKEYDADIVQCGFVRGVATSFPIVGGKVRVDKLNNHSVFLTERANIIMCGKLFRLSLFDGIRMPVGLYNEDDWTTWKLYYKSQTIVVTNQRLYYYTANPNSTMARLGKKPDLRYINAYDKRIEFFIQTGETDLEHCSRLQLCKSLLLNYRNKMLTREEKQRVKAKFEESWMELCHSPYIRLNYKILFFIFSFFPFFVSKVAAQLR